MNKLILMLCFVTLAGCDKVGVGGSIDRAFGSCTGPIDTDGGTQAIAFHENQRGEITTNDTLGAINNGGGKPGQGYPAVHAGMAVRRLTPRECERLQGFPDDYTLIEYKRKPATDGVRYKGLGNSMAVPVMAWIGRRIDMYSQVNPGGTS